MPGGATGNGQRHLVDLAIAPGAPRLGVQTADLKYALGAMGLGVEPTDEFTAAQNGQHKVAMHALGLGGVALQAVVKVKQATRALAAAMMTEGRAVAEALGVRFKISLDQRIAGAEAVGAHKTSMLVDVENGRVLELEALVGSVVELGRITGVPTPTIEAIYAATSLLARTLATRHGRLRLEAAS